MSEKLTKLRRITLRAIEAGHVYEAKLGCSSIRIRGASPTVVRRLIQMELAEWASGENGRIAQLTDAGREALERNPS